MGYIKWRRMQFLLYQFVNRWPQVDQVRVGGRGYTLVILVHVETHDRSEHQ